MIKIEVTGNTIPELADKLLAIGASLQGTITMYDTPARKTPPKKAEVMPEVGNFSKLEPVDPTPTPKSAPTAKASESQPTTAEPSSTPAPVEELEVVDLPIATIDFETEIRPLALKVVEKHSKPVLEIILSRFGVARASLVPAARMSELHAALQEALSK